jgi:hypothetical protein
VPVRAAEQPCLRPGEDEVLRVDQRRDRVTARDTDGACQSWPGGRMPALGAPTVRLGAAKEVFPLVRSASSRRKRHAQSECAHIGRRPPLAALHSGP